jgi:homopolymeric O-antigen transport system permease protein
VFLRPSPLLSALVDTFLASTVYLAAYWLRFQGDGLDSFLSRTLLTLPLVVGAQILALLCLRAYVPRPRTDWLVRVTLGPFVGAAVAAALIGLTAGLAGSSRMVFAADALLLSIAAIGWRGVWVLRARVRVRAMAQQGSQGSAALVDRSEEMTTLGAVVGSLYRYRELLKNLVLKDLKLKYRGSVFGFVWSLANPLLMIIVYALAFTYVLRVRSERFVFYLMLGQLSWTFFASSASMSTGSIVENSGLIKSVFFPRAILPVGTVLFNLAQYLLTVSVFLPAMLIWYRVPLSGSMVLFPVFLALQTAFTIGIALMLATATAFLRDVRHLLEVALMALFWATPILYELRQVPEKLRLAILLSPMSSFIVAYQQLFFYREWPDPAVWVVACVYAAGAFITGTMLILAFEDRFTEQV